VGHETDFTIADFVADLRAPTPSAAAELITEAQHKVEDLVAALSNRLVRAARFQLLQARQRLARVPIAYAEQRMMTGLHRWEQRLDDLSFRMESAMGELLRDLNRGVAELSACVLRHDPRQLLSVARESLAASQSRLNHALHRSLTAARYRQQSVEARLYRAAQVSVAGRRSAWANLRGELQAMSPLAVLQRGYALVQDEGGAVVRSVELLTTNQSLTTLLGDGSFSSKITTISSNKVNKKKKDKPTSR
jgi:exodeoxyribonuclease VII large subunit